MWGGGEISGVTNTLLRIEISPRNKDASNRLDSVSGCNRASGNTPYARKKCALECIAYCILMYVIHISTFVPCVSKQIHREKYKKLLEDIMLLDP